MLVSYVGDFGLHIVKIDFLKQCSSRLNSIESALTLFVIFNWAL